MCLPDAEFGRNDYQEDTPHFIGQQVKFLANKLFQALHDESKDDADSIHSFDLNESVSRIVTNVIDGFHEFTQDDLRNVWIKFDLGQSLFDQVISLFDESLNCDDEFDDLDTQIKSLLTQWGNEEYDLFKKDMNKMKIHENGRYLSGTIMFYWKKLKNNSIIAYPCKINLNLDTEIEKWKSTNQLRQQLPNG